MTWSLTEPRVNFLAALIKHVGPHVAGGFVFFNVVRYVCYVSIQFAWIRKKFAYLIIQVISYHACDDTRCIIVIFHVFSAYSTDVGGYVRGNDSYKIGVFLIID